MSDIFDHEFDAWESNFNGYLEHELGEEYYYSKPFDKDPWKYHNWYNLAAFHKDFEKAILVSLRVDGCEKSYMIPKSIIGKLETTVNFKTNTSTSKYLIHQGTFRKLSPVEITYAQGAEDFKFVMTSFDGRYSLRNANRTIEVTPDKVQYVRWAKIEDQK